MKALQVAIGLTGIIIVGVGVNVDVDGASVITVCGEDIGVGIGGIFSEASLLEGGWLSTANKYVVMPTEDVKKNANKMAQNLFIDKNNFSFEKVFF